MTTEEILTTWSLFAPLLAQIIWLGARIFGFLLVFPFKMKWVQVLMISAIVATCCSELGATTSVNQYSTLPTIQHVFFVSLIALLEFITGIVLALPANLVIKFGAGLLLYTMDSVRGEQTASLVNPLSDRGDGGISILGELVAFSSVLLCGGFDRLFVTVLSPTNYLLRGCFDFMTQKKTTSPFDVRLGDSTVHQLAFSGEGVALFFQRMGDSLVSQMLPIVSESCLVAVLFCLPIVLPLLTLTVSSRFVNANLGATDVFSVSLMFLGIFVLSLC